MAKLFTNSREPDQTPQNASSNLGLHCLPITTFFLRRSGVVGSILKRVMLCLKYDDGIANSADLIKLLSLTWGYICSGISTRILRLSTEYFWYQWTSTKVSVNLWLYIDKLFYWHIKYIGARIKENAYTNRFQSQERKFLWLPVCFSIHLHPSKKTFTL